MIPDNFKILFGRACAKLASGFCDLRRSGWFDKWLLLAVAIGVILGAQGFTWGRYDCLNLDRMALRKMITASRPPFHPGSFVKPPFYTYMNHFVAHVPASTVSRNLLWLEPGQRKQIYYHMRLALARSLNLAFFAGCTVMLFGLVRGAWGPGAARLASLLFATSAGFVPYQVFLTTDLALVFMMLASFACAVKIVDNPGMGISIAAGLLAGLAAATKYNGLIVAVALPVAHLLASRGNPLLACVKRPAAWVCGLCVPVGFLIGNPYTLLDWPTFSADFLYNYKVTPVYNGATAGTGYGAFFRAFIEILGWPGSVFVLLATLVGLVALRSARGRNGAHLWLLSAVVFCAYTMKIGSFPRMETRFVIPAAPFAILLAAAGFSALLRAKWLTVPAFAMIAFYNVACGWQVGIAFRKDPRMRALDYAGAHLEDQATVEVSGSIPRIQDLPGKKLKIIRIPTGLERRENFTKMFAADQDIQAGIARWEAKTDISWFSREARKQRNPDWIFWSTIDLESIARKYYEELFEKGSVYEVVFDEPPVVFPPWSYPRHTEFIRSRVTIWKKTPGQL